MITEGINGQKIRFSNPDEFRKAIEKYINSTLEYYEEKFGRIVPAAPTLDGYRKELVEILSKLRVWHWERYGVKPN